MNLKLDINTTRISLRIVGIAAMALGGVVALVGLFRRALLAPAVGLFLAGVVLYGRPYQFLIRYPRGAVVAQITQTLKLIGWQYSSENDIISVPAVKAQIAAQALPGATLLQFRFSGEITKREEFLVSTLVKFQRYTDTAKE